jgi:hypothetical protein
MNIHLYIYIVDVAMSSPPLMGSSRTSGGLFRGRAHGNIPNHADITTPSMGFLRPVKGEVHLYVSDQYPRNIKFEFLQGDSDLVVMVNVVGTMAPILEAVGNKFSIIRGLFFIYF